MTDGIAAIASRIAQLRSELGLAAVPVSTSGTTGATGTTGTTGTAGNSEDFAALLKVAQQKAADIAAGKYDRVSGGKGAGKKTGAAGDAPPVNHTKSKVYGGGSKLTPRTRNLITEIDARFGPFPAIGGWRADGGIPGGGEHPLGRAADFMLTTNGKLPTAAQRAKGQQIADWAKANAQRLGIKYIIYNQHIWNPLRASEGWRLMEDRGSITQNHKDHVHISMN